MITYNLIIMYMHTYVGEDPPRDNANRDRSAYQLQSFQLSVCNNQGEETGDLGTVDSFDS